MSKSLARVKAHAEDINLQIEIIETPSGTQTAQMAAEFCGCDIGQIAKSILFRSDETLFMFITSGAKRVDVACAEILSGSPLAKADADLIREVTGFAIGGVSPLGSLTPIIQFFDANLLQYSKIFAAAGTPHHLFAIDPKMLVDKIGATVSEFTV